MSKDEKNTPKNLIIVIGPDHNNTLNTLRHFGAHKMNYRILGLSDKTDPAELRIAHSRYAKGKLTLVPDETEAIYAWLRDFHCPTLRPVLYPCCDSAMYAIDKYAEELREKYILPGFVGHPGLVCELMDKFRQSEFAETIGVKMAKTWRIGIAEKVSLPTDMVYPCILKPVVSATGSKSDICVAADREELCELLMQLLKKGYTEVLAQQFLTKEYEVCAFGCVLSDGTIYNAMLRKVRDFPVTGGSTSFAYFCDEERVLKCCHHILENLAKAKYNGQFDIELLCCSDGIYLNEINFRQSANVQAALKGGVDAPLAWIQDRTGHSVTVDKTRPEVTLFHAHDLNEIAYNRSLGRPIKELLSAMWKADSYAVWSLRDIPGTWAFYKPIVSRFLTKKRK